MADRSRPESKPVDASPPESAIDPEREEDERVLRAVLAGEDRAFDDFVARFGSRIFGFGMRMCGRREDAEDVFQETLTTVFRKVQTLREPRALTSWLYRIIANACLTRRRRSTFAPDEELSLEDLLQRGGVAEDGLAIPAVDDPEGVLLRKELADHLEAAVRDLPPKYRIVWVLRDVEALSVAETAEALDISISNVKMRLHRARLALRKRLSHVRTRGNS
jgi:RNA polymerase sigma-70 factor (ECF subfamily)